MKGKEGGCLLLEVVISVRVHTAVCMRVNRHNVLFCLQFSRPFAKLACVCCGGLK